MSTEVPRKPVQISPADGQVLDKLLAERAGERSAPPWRPEQRPRVEKMTGLLELFGQCPAESAPVDLVERTLRHVLEADQRERMTAGIAMSQVQRGPGLGVGWGQLLAVAAMLLIVTSLALPILGYQRDTARRIACSSNLQATGVAFNEYAADHAQTLPRWPTVPGSQWFQVGRRPNGDGLVRSNSAHLFLLANKGYVHPDTLVCPSNAQAPTNMSPKALDWAKPAQVSYSYQNQYTSKVIRIDRFPAMAVLADKNPLFVIEDGKRLRFRDDLSPASPSHVHRRGQNILTASGSVTWQGHPVLSNGDNIWLIHGIHSAYQGNESPVQPSDSFLVP